MKISSIVTWPIHMDYPLWRFYSSMTRDVISERIVGFVNNHDGDSVAPYVESKMGAKDTFFINALERREEDWRHKAVSLSYQHATGEYILFTEQDFFMMPDALDSLAEHIVGDFDFIAHDDEGRLHPAFLLVRKSLSDQVSRDYSPIKDKADHFYRYTESLKELSDNYITLQRLGMEEYDQFVHLTGLTHNYSRIAKGLLPTKMDEFVIYNQFVMRVVESDNPLYNRFASAITYAEDGGDYTKHKLHVFFERLWASCVE